MNLNLARKFLLDYLPPDGQLPVNEIFDKLKSDPVLVLNNGLIFNHFEYFKNLNKQIAVASVNGVICGFALAYVMQIDPSVEAQLEEHCQAAARIKGDNVINFLQKRTL